jgi:hypothetical protein
VVVPSGKKWHTEANLDLWLRVVLARDVVWVFIVDS